MAATMGDERSTMVGDGTRRALRLEPVSAAWANGFVVAAQAGPVFHGPGPADYLCGACDLVLCEGVGTGLFRGVMFRCACGALNRVPAAFTAAPGGDRDGVQV
jgi:hypothetical protein